MRGGLAAALLGALLAPACPAPARAQEAPALSTGPAFQIVWPPEGARLPFVTRSFTHGRVTAGSTMAVNGTTVPVDGDGVFFELVPFSSGTFVLDYEAVRDGVYASTRVAVEVGPPGGLPRPAPGELLALEPSQDRVLAAGDRLLVRCAGPPGLRGELRIGGLARAPLVEAPAAAPGLYEGFYAPEPGHRGAALEAVCSLKTGFLGRLSARAPGRVTVAGPGAVRAAVTTAQTTVLKTAPGGYSLFFPPGIRLETDGADGDLLRVRLSEHEEGWVDRSRVSLLPEGTPPERGVVGRSLRVEVSSDAVRLVVEASARVPFEVRQEVEPLAFEVRFFNAQQRLDRIRYAPDDPVVREVRWRQESSRVVRLDVATRLRWGWGYDARYDSRGRFVLAIRRPPDLTRSKRILSGRRVVVDAGHGPDTGAIGPRGTLEMDANLAIARALEARLRSEGAEVYMVRASSEGPSLLERPSLAWEARGDLFVSVHNNSFPVTEDPFSKPRGFMTFYYRPQSRPLAEAVHSSYRKNLPELADESLQWGDLHVCRATQMPAILTESAYVILPDHEKRLLDPAFQERLAGTIAGGIRAYLESYRALQLSEPSERRAAAPGP